VSIHIPVIDSLIDPIIPHRSSSFKTILVNFESFLDHRSASLQHMLDLIVEYGKECLRRRGELDSGIEINIAIGQPVAAVFAWKMSNDQNHKCARTDLY